MPTIVEVPAPEGPFGANGIGEASILAGPAAIANAIAASTGCAYASCRCRRRASGRRCDRGTRGRGEASLGSERVRTQPLGKAVVHTAQSFLVAGVVAGHATHDDDAFSGRMARIGIAEMHAKHGGGTLDRHRSMRCTTALSLVAAGRCDRTAAAFTSRSRHWSGYALG